MKAIKYIIFFLVVLSCATAIKTWPDTDREKEARRILADSYFAAGDHGRALAAYEKIANDAPDDLAVRMRMAQLLAWNKRYDDSLVQYRYILERDPKNIEALRGLADIAKWSQDLTAAAAGYKRVLELLPGQRDVLIDLSEVLIWQGKHEQAAVYLEEAVAGQDSKAALLHGEAFLRAGKHEQAQRIFLNILEKEPDNRRARLLLADSYAYSQDHVKAIAGYKELLKEQDDPEIKRRLADTLSWAKQYQSSVALYDDILIRKYDAAIARQKARVLGWAKDYSAADAQYAAVLEPAVVRLCALERRGQNAFWSGRHIEAILL